MRRRRLSSGLIVFLAFCALAVVSTAVILIAGWLSPPAYPDTTTEEQIVSEPETPPPIPETEPPVPEVPVFHPPLEIETPVAEPRVITALPVRMRIPALSLDYEVEATGADAEGTMKVVPALDITAWFQLSSIPGNEGNAILAGHNMWSGERSRLYTLDEVQIGDEMEIEYDDGTSLIFRMESVFVYPLASAPAHLIMSVLGEARVTLITCKPPFNTTTGTSDNRIVATFKEEDVFVIPDPPIERYPLLEA